MRTAISIPSSFIALPQCTPNLMPFHINYSGPAAVKTFMLVEKLFGKSETTEATTKLEEESISETMLLTSKNNMPTPELSMKRKSTSMESTLDDPLPTSLTEPTSTLTVSSQTIITQFTSPPIGDAEKRFVSTFRGRSIHGLSVDMPDGYVGVVLRTTANSEIEAEGQKSEGSRTAGYDRDEKEVGTKLRGSRCRGRLTSSAAPRKRATVTISDDDDNASLNKTSNSLDKDLDIDMVDPPLTTFERDDPTRLLVPTERFSSFTIWQADRMVDKSNDEYWRALTEWIALAHEVGDSSVHFTSLYESRILDS